MTLKLEGYTFFILLVLSVHLIFLSLTLFLCLSTPCQLMRTCRWLVMNSDEHMGQICVYVCVCMHKVVNARPAALLSLCPSLKTSVSLWEETSWFCQRQLQPALPEAWLRLQWDEAHWRREGYPKTEEEEKDKLIRRFGERIKEIQLDWECVERRKAKACWKYSIIFYPLQLNTLIIINLQCYFSHKLLLWFSVNSVSAALINRLLWGSFRSKHFAFRITLPYTVLSVNRWEL